MQRTLKLIIEIFSILTAMSFLLSALLQMALFAIWGFDFTAIASVEDVILGGLRFFGIFCAAAVVFTAPVFATMVVNSVPPSKLQWLVTTFIIVSNVIAVLAFTWRPFGNANSILVGGWIMLGSAFILYAIGMYNAKVPYLKMITAPGLAGLFAFHALISSVMASTSMLSGYPFLSFTDTKVLPADCQNDPSILWIGSSTLLISCENAKHVVFRKEGMTLFRNN